MGCISSKGICRSISIREDLSHRFQSSASAWEELMTSNDHLFALLSSSKLTSKLPSTKCDLSNNLSAAEPDLSAAEPNLRRSKSCQLPVDNENKLEIEIGSRSFHTVEEYDALVQKLKDGYSWEDVMLKGSNSVETSKDDHQIKSCENGWKRRGVAKGLKSLDVPSIEFPSVARLKLEGYPTTAYVTPKFGSYNVAEKEGGGGGGESTVFSQDLLAAFEDCMQQLQVDQDAILREMEDGYSSVDHDDEMNLV